MRLSRSNFKSIHSVPFFPLAGVRLRPAAGRGARCSSRRVSMSLSQREERKFVSPGLDAPRILSRFPATRAKNCFRKKPIRAIPFSSPFGRAGVSSPRGRSRFLLIFPRTNALASAVTCCKIRPHKNSGCQAAEEARRALYVLSFSRADARSRSRARSLLSPPSLFVSVGRVLQRASSKYLFHGTFSVPDTRCASLLLFFSFSLRPARSSFFPPPVSPVSFLTAWPNSCDESGRLLPVQFRARRGRRNNAKRKQEA